MYVQALEDNLSAGGIEILIFQLTDLSTVNRISPITTELLHVEMIGTLSDFLIRGKSDTDLTVLDLRMILQILHRGDDSGYTSLIIGT